MRAQRKSRKLAPNHGSIPLREFAPIVLAGVVFLSLYAGVTHLAATQGGDRKWDLVEAGTLEGRGVITGLIFAPGGGSSSGRAMLLELDGHPVNLDLWDPGSALRLQVGQEVAFTYNVGRSGAWYIKRIARIPATGVGRGGVGNR